MWVELTDEYASKIKDGARRKIRLRNGLERWAYWLKRECCFFWNSGEDAVYMDSPGERPTHIWCKLTMRAPDLPKRGGSVSLCPYCGQLACMCSSTVNSASG